MDSARAQLLRELARAFEGLPTYSPLATVLGGRLATTLADGFAGGVMRADLANGAVCILDLQTSAPAGGVWVLSYGVADGLIVREVTPTASGFDSIRLPLQTIVLTWRNTSGAPQTIEAAACLATLGATGGTP